MHMHLTTPAIAANETYTVTRAIMFNKRESRVNRFLHGVPMAFSAPQTIDNKEHKQFIEKYLWNTPGIYVTRARMNAKSPVVAADSSDGPASKKPRLLSEEEIDAGYDLPIIGRLNT
eukprot:2294964-Amphidinium_carterae.1